MTPQSAMRHGLWISSRDSVPQDLNRRSTIFGIGYSSLVQLHRLPFSELKIDRSFASDLTTRDEPRKICEVIVVLEHKLGLKCVAEGVETVDTLAAICADPTQKLRRTDLPLFAAGERPIRRPRGPVSRRKVPFDFSAATMANSSRTRRGKRRSANMVAL